MITLRAATLICLLTLSLSSCPAADDSAWSDATKFFSRLVGEWKANNMRITYEWGVNQRLMKQKSFRAGEGGEHLAYETVYAWHPKSQSIFAMSFGADGTVFDDCKVEAKGDILDATFTAYSSASATPFRSKIQLVDKDSYQWTLFVKKDDQWQQIVQTTFRRDKKTDTQKSSESSGK